MRRSTLSTVAVVLSLLPTPLARGGPVPDEEGVPGGEALLARMHRQFDDVRAIHRALVFGDLPAARRRARALARMPRPEGLVEGEAAVERIRRTARRLGTARSQVEARRRLAAIAVACAGCHEDVADASRFLWAPEPEDDGSAAARMARHRWASESAWMGLVAPSDRRWREGMDALAAIPLPVEAISDDRERYPTIERWSRELAARAARARQLDDQGARGRALAGLTELCVACHAVTR